MVALTLDQGRALGRHDADLPGEPGVLGTSLPVKLARCPERTRNGDSP